MKANDNRQAAQAHWEAYASSAARILFLIILSTLHAGQLKGQPCPWNSVLHHGEQISYELYFKWGFIMPKAGLAQFSVKESTANSQTVWEYRMHFNTVSMFDKIFKMRDTLTSYFSPGNQLVYSDKRTDEGGYYLADKMK